MDENYNFNAEEQTRGVTEWIRNWFEVDSGGAEGVIVGISGGCDSMVTAALCCKAIGTDRVRGVLMPNEIQPDISDSYRVCRFLGIEHYEIDIGGAYRGIIGTMPGNFELAETAKINIAPRLRMMALYAMAQTLNYRVAGTGNLSEKYVGYFTKWGDAAHDFNPIANFTKTEVKQIGDCLGLPHELVSKAPADGLSGVSDEENMKITYAVLDDFIRTKSYDEKDGEVKEMIDRITKMHKNARHKINSVPCYIY